MGLLFVDKQPAPVRPVRGALRAGPVVALTSWGHLLSPGRCAVTDSSHQVWRVLVQPRQPASLVPGDSVPGRGRFVLADPALGKLDQKIAIQSVSKPNLHALDKTPAWCVPPVALRGARDRRLASF